ncbi:hypothetical protein ES703_17978 [subsurface metagenome]
MKDEAIETIRKILKSYHNQNLTILTKFSKRLMIAEQRISEFEDRELWLEQTQGWQGQDLKSLKETVESLEQQLNTIKLEKMSFDNP